MHKYHSHEIKVYPLETLPYENETGKNKLVITLRLVVPINAKLMFCFRDRVHIEIMTNLFCCSMWIRA